RSGVDEGADSDSGVHIGSRRARCCDRLRNECRYASGRGPGTEHRAPADSALRSIDLVLVFHGIVLLYQYNFRATCICRGVLDWLVTTPNVLLFRFKVGAAKTVRLNMLNASHRKSMRFPSASRNDFAILIFSLNVGNERALGL